MNGCVEFFEAWKDISFIRLYLNLFGIELFYSLPLGLLVRV